MYVKMLFWIDHSFFFGGGGLKQDPGIERIEMFS
jgi:hypothetical protein